MHITIILAVMLKSAILIPKKSMCPILPLNKNCLRNYIEPKHYLVEGPEWQDDSIDVSHIAPQQKLLTA